MTQYISIASLLVIMIGWIASNYLSKKKEVELSKIKWQKEHLDNQLKCLYGPLYSILIENKQARDILRELFHRQTLFEFGEKLTVEENEKYENYLETILIPNNRKMVDIIKNNLHLLPGGDISPNFISFIKYTMKIEYIHKQMKASQDFYGQHGYENYDKNFQEEVITTTNKIKARQWLLIGDES